MTEDTLSNREQRWATLLNGCSLVTEADVDPTDAISGLAEVAQKYRARRASKEWRTRELRRYPATIVVGLTAIGSLDYDEGTYWPQFRKRTSLSSAQHVPQEFSDAFRQGLKRFRLSRFDLPQRNVGEILMHAGIPLSSLEGLLNILVDRSQLRPDLTGADFCSWISRLTDPHANQRGLDVPTRRFLREGREIAFDLIDRYLAVIDAISSGASENVEAAVAQLPGYIGRVVHRLIESGRVRKLPSNKRRTRRQTPEVAYIDQLVQIQLPSSILDKPRDWSFSAGDASWIAETHPPLFHDPNHLAYIKVPSPAETVVCKLDDEDLSWALDMVDPSTRILAFSKVNHVLIPARAELPPEEVWLALPEGDPNAASIEEALEVEGEYHILEVADTPFGWTGWTFALLDLERTSRLRLRGVNTWRWVSTAATPRLLSEEHVRHLVATDGNPVLSRAPRVLIPGTSPERQTRHNITISRPDGEVIHRVEIGPSFDVQVVNPWEQLSKPILGTWIVGVRGTLGRGRSFKVHVAERCSVSATPANRYFGDKGLLEPCSTQISLEGVVTRLDLEAGIPETNHHLQGSNGSLDVKVAPTCMWARVVQANSLTHRSYGTVQLETESLGSTILDFYVPRATKPTILLTLGSETLQEAVPATLRSGISKVGLGQFADTTRGLGKLELWCDWEQDQTLLATIAPRRLLLSATVENDWVIVVKAHESLDLELTITLDYAPWLPPKKLRMPSGIDRLSLPTPCIGRGPIKLKARMYDPWGGLESCTAPVGDDSNAFSISSPVHNEAETLEDQIIHWIAGKANLPRTNEALERGLQCYGTLPHVRSGLHINVLYKEFADFTRSFNRHFLPAASTVNWSRATHARLLAEGWPATAAPQGQPATDSIWEASPYLGLLATGAHTDDPLWWEMISTTLGDEAQSILSTGQDPSARSGSFPPEAVILASLPHDRQDRMWRDIAQNAQGAFLSGGRRQVHSRPLFDARANVCLQELIDQSSEIIHFAKSELASHRSGAGISAIEARITSLGWQSLPALTLSIAFIARLAARGLGHAALGFELYRSFFADLATLAPEYVEQDLILAELWLTHWETHEDH